MAGMGAATEIAKYNINNNPSTPICFKVIEGDYVPGGRCKAANLISGSENPIRRLGEENYGMFPSEFRQWGSVLHKKYAKSVSARNRMDRNFRKCWERAQAKGAELRDGYPGTKDVAAGVVETMYNDPDCSWFKDSSGGLSHRDKVPITWANFEVRPFQSRVLFLPHYCLSSRNLNRFFAFPIKPTTTVRIY